MKPIEKKTTTITTTSTKNTFEDKSKDLSDIYDLVQVEEYNDGECFTTIYIYIFQLIFHRRRRRDY